jgi:arsenate reductase
MAETFLRQFAGDYFKVYSAGMHANPIHPLTTQVMEELGYDLSEQYSKKLSEYLGKVHFGISITVCDKAREQCPLHLSLGTRLDWPFEDPAEFIGTDEEKLAKFRGVRDLIKAKILEWLESREITPKLKD